MHREPLTQHERLVWQMVSIACLMIVGMTIFESAKQLIRPTITLWESHIVTIFFSSAYATAASYFFLRRLIAKHHENALLKKELEAALEEIQPLTSLLPICAACKNIRDDQGYWKQIELYIREHTNIDFSHGICPSCAVKLYPEYAEESKPN